MEKTKFRSNLESIIVSKVYTCSDVKLAQAAALMIDCQDWPY